MSGPGVGASGGTSKPAYRMWWAVPLALWSVASMVVVERGTLLAIAWFASGGLMLLTCILADKADKAEHATPCHTPTSNANRSES